MRRLLAIAAGAAGWSIASLTWHAGLEDGLVTGWTFDDGAMADAFGVRDGELRDGAKIVKGGKIGRTLDVGLWGLRGGVERRRL